MPASAQPSVRLLVYNDLADVTPHLSPDLETQLLAKLLANPNVTLTDRPTLTHTITRTHPEIKSFDVCIALGHSGVRVAQALHDQTGWFPRIQMLPVTRIELAESQYVLMKDSQPFHEIDELDPQLTSLALVDDTIYSGLTLKTILSKLPTTLLPTTKVFALQAIAETMPLLTNLCPVIVGTQVAGKIGTEASIIKASGLFERGAIRRLHQPDLAFFQRRNWMEDWFPVNAKDIIELCRVINIENMKKKYSTVSSSVVDESIPASPVFLTT